MGVLPPAAENEAGDGDDESEVSGDEQGDGPEVLAEEQGDEPEAPGVVNHFKHFNLPFTYNQLKTLISNFMYSPSIRKS